MIDLHVQAEYDYNLLDVDITQVSDYRIEGRSHQISPRPYVWSNDADQEYVVNSVSYTHLELIWFLILKIELRVWDDAPRCS